MLVLQRERSQARLYFQQLLGDLRAGRDAGALWLPPRTGPEWREGSPFQKLLKGSIWQLRFYPVVCLKSVYTSASI